MSAGENATWVAILTPLGRGAIASLVVEGPNAVDAVAALFRSASGKALADQPAGRILYGKWKPTGEEVVVARRGHARVEIHCHGGMAASQSILHSLAAAGCRAISWQDSVAREESNSVRASARIALADAPTERAARILLDQYHGALDAALEQVVNDLRAGLGSAAAERLRSLLKWVGIGEHLTSPWRVAIGGPPNVGKSTLLNALLGYERAIVFDQPGTTRDIVSAVSAIDGWPFEFSDMAGLRQSDDPLEQAGVALAVAEMSSADLMMLVFDASKPWTPDFDRMVEERPEAIIVHNKADLLPADLVERAAQAGKAVVYESAERPPGFLLSARTGFGLTTLLAAIGHRLVPEPPAAGDAVPFSPEQVECIGAALHYCEAGDFEQTASVLARLARRPLPP